MADNETIADIAAEKRRIAKEVRDYASNGDYWDKKRANETAEDLEEEADRLEAAHKRERGNAAKLREALVKCREIALQWQADEADGVEGTTDKPHARSAAEAVVDMEFEINAALSAPPRNCDIGTVDDQKDRFLEFCDDEKGPREHCRNCRLCDSPDCELAWAQMPYEEGGDK